MKKRCQKVCGHIFWQIGNSVILSAAKNLVFLAARARFFAALRMTDLARKNGRTRQEPLFDRGRGIL